MRIQGEKGFSLLEVLIAIAILSILMGGFLTLMQAENQVIRASAEILSARLKANEAMERVKATRFDELKSFSVVTVSKQTPMTVDVQVSNFSETEGLKKVVTSVKWFDQRGREREYKLTTLRTRYHQRSQALTAFVTQEKGGEL
ncbi:type II secretory pathway [Candidatus Vecturithrix granuli]|uniref:Type II secretory pathway n=1 Tax=Vecturithrix granuli TaxID=1499967 RepID=A0A0S6W5Y2_VECG1|nr:type II secretory pathway [Candidatus Vecturithrix granuli]